MCQVRPLASIYPRSGPTNQRRASGTLCQYLSKRVDDQVSTFMAIKPSDEENPFWVGVTQVPVLGHPRCRDGNDLGIIQRAGRRRRVSVPGRRATER